MSAPPLVLHLITDLTTGGAQMALARLVAALDRARFRSHVVALTGGEGAVAARIRAAGVPVTDLRMTNKARLDAFLRLHRLLRRERPTILHSWMFHAAIAGRLVGRAARVPILVSGRRDINIGGAARERLNALTVRLDDHVTAVCEAARVEELRQTGLPPERVTTIPNGIELQRFERASDGARARLRAELGLPEGAALIAHIGRLHPQKGHRTLIDAWAALPGRAHLLLVGEGALRGALEGQVEALGLAGRVRFLGERRDVPALLAGLDALVLPSLWEGMPNVALEAMGAALPVVATAVGGTPEVVVPGESGWLVPPADTGALAAALNELLADEGRARAFGAAGRRRVEAHFTVERFVAAHEALYERLLAEAQKA